MLAMVPGRAVSAEFVPLGFDVSTLFSGGNILKVAEDGTTVVGLSPSNGLTRWTTDTGPEALFDARLHVGISGDGAIIAGSQRVSPGFPIETRAVIIDDGTIRSLLPHNSGISLVSQNGTIIGQDHEDDFSFRWNEGEIEPLSDLPDDLLDGGLRAVSADGKILVSQRPAYRWSDADGAQRLLGAEGETDANALGISSDGRWTVGRRGSSTQSRAIRWDGEVAEQLLGMNETWGTAAKDVTANGKVVVGRIYLSDEQQGQNREIVAGVWHESLGEMTRLPDLLKDRYGIDPGLDDYHLTGIYDVTDDGRFMVGHMMNPDGLDEAFLLDLGLLGDFNSDELVGAADIDLLSEAIRTDSNDLSFDIDFNNVVNELDQKYWVNEIAATVLGDADLDRDVDFTDFLALSNSFGGSGGWAKGDFTGDGHILFDDFLVLSANFGQPASASSTLASVPEPTTDALAWFALLSGGIQFFRRRPSSKLVGVNGDKVC